MSHYVFSQCRLVFRHLVNRRKKSMPLILGWGKERDRTYKMTTFLDENESHVASTFAYNTNGRVLR